MSSSFRPDWIVDPRRLPESSDWVLKREPVLLRWTPLIALATLAAVLGWLVRAQVANPISYSAIVLSVDRTEALRSEIWVVLDVSGGISIPVGQSGELRASTALLATPIRVRVLSTRSPSLASWKRAEILLEAESDATKWPTPFVARLSFPGRPIPLVRMLLRRLRPHPSERPEHSPPP